MTSCRVSRAISSPSADCLLEYQADLSGVVDAAYRAVKGQKLVFAATSNRIYCYSDPLRLDDLGVGIDGIKQIVAGPGIGCDVSLYVLSEDGGVRRIGVSFSDKVKSDYDKVYNVQKLADGCGSIVAGNGTCYYV